MPRFLFALLFAAIPAAYAQDPAPGDAPADPARPEAKPDNEPEAKPDPKTIVQEALTRLRQRPELLAEVEVAQDDAARAGGQAGVFIIRTSYGGQRKPFRGKAYAWRSADGVLVITSASEVPGFAMYIAGERTIARTTYEGQAFDTGELKAELVPLFDLDAIATQVAGATWKAIVDEKGTTTYSAEFAKEAVRPREGRNMMAARVLKVKASVTVGADGELATLRVGVVHNDPTKEMMRGRIIIMGPNGPQVQPKGGDAKHDVEGKTTTYEVRFRRRGNPPARMRDFKASVAQALEAEDTDK
ncbi:MAG: hypothetical protein OER88_03360 [Planctomycetota bacterium]|nr:hypothetical protein [Planctomycetota bacterium]